LKKVTKNIAESVRARLHTVAREQSASYNDVLQTCFNEALLARIAQSTESANVLLKGAQMLRVWGVFHARPTMDIDLLRRGEATANALVTLVSNWASVKTDDDGVVFDPSTIEAEAIRDETEYKGTRIRLSARLGNMRQKVQIDFGVGDAVYPAPVQIQIARLLGNANISCTVRTATTHMVDQFLGR
jgi:ribulose 1,5-bisphosphate synthetase/thiazole synthase